MKRLLVVCIVGLSGCAIQPSTPTMNNSQSTSANTIEQELKSMESEDIHHSKPVASIAPDLTQDLSTGELQHCIVLEQEMLNVFDKLNRKDEIITKEYDKFRRINLRMRQIQTAAKHNTSVKKTYDDLSRQKANQISGVLALFRDRSAIFKRMKFLQTDRKRQCLNKDFHPRELIAACRDAKSSKSFRCTMRF